MKICKSDRMEIDECACLKILAEVQSYHKPLPEE